MPGPTCAVSPSIVCLPVKTTRGSPNSRPILLNAEASAKLVASVSEPAKARSVNRTAAIDTKGQRPAQRVLRRWRPHGEHRDRAANLVAHPQRLFEREEVIGIDDRRHALAHDRIGDRMHANLRAVRNLLDANDDMHLRYAPFSTAVSVVICTRGLAGFGATASLCTLNSRSLIGEDSTKS